MSKNGILIFITTIIILLIIAFICIFKGNNTSGGKVEKLYNKISENKTYTFFMEEANNNYKTEAEKFKNLEIDSIKKLNNSSLLGVIHKNLNEQRKKVANFFKIAFVSY